MNRTLKKLLILLTIIGFYIFNCEGILFLEYLKIKFNNLSTFNSSLVSVQFVNDFTDSKYCYLTVNNIYYDEQSSYLIFTYFPRTVRIIFQQLFILSVVGFVLFEKIKFDKINKNQFFSITCLGLLLNYLVVSLYVDFETITLLVVFLFFSAIKSLIAFSVFESENKLLILFVLCLFPFSSTGFGFPWFFDFLVYLSFFILFHDKKILVRNKLMSFFVISLILSFVYPTLNSPSLESTLIQNQSNFESIVDNLDLNTSRNTYLEKKDINELRSSFKQLDNDNFEKIVISVSKNLKDINYPDRWKFMVATLPDAKSQLLSFIWYLVISILFFRLIIDLNNKNTASINENINKASAILFFYPVLSIFSGLSFFVNSISEFLFALSRKSELIDIGNIQTWRGINDHYEVFSNLQLFCLIFFLMNTYLNRNRVNYLYITVSVVSLILTQSRWTTIVTILLLFIGLIYLHKYILKQIIVISLIIILMLQIVPVFDRGEPFFTNPDTTQTGLYDEAYMSEDFWFEPISNRLNRTHAWSNFASGYNPNIVSFSFGHGTGAYLNIVKNTVFAPTSGPHSLILQILNKFGILGISFFIISLYAYFQYLAEGRTRKGKFIILTIILFILSLEVKTDSIMLVDGTVIYLFGLLIPIMFKISNNKKTD